MITEHANRPCAHLVNDTEDLNALRVIVSLPLSVAVCMLRPAVLNPLCNMSRALTVCLMIFGAFFAQHASAQARIIFLGDSITEAGANPGGYVALVADSLAVVHPAATVIGAGVSGDKVPDLLMRLDRDVLSQDPSHVVIYIGINDVWHFFEFEGVTGTDPDVFEAGLRELILRIETQGATVLLCTPSVIGEDARRKAPVNDRLIKYAEMSRRVAEETGVQLCDLRAAFESYLAENNPSKAYEGILTTDGVHLNEAGNRFVADFMIGVLSVVLSP